MTTSLRAAALFGLAPVLLLTATSRLNAQSEPPIRIVIDIHMDPMYAYPASIRPQVYQRWMGDTDSLLDIIEPQGAQISFLSCGEFMEYVVDEGASGAGAQFLQRIYSLGGQIGSHSHSERQTGPHQWIATPNSATQQQQAQVWTDNIRWVDQAIQLSLGTPLPAPLREINTVRGSHVPKLEPSYHALMQTHGFLVREGGPEEDFYGLFTHYLYHPYRPSASNVIDEDLNAPFVAVPQGAVIGRVGSHKGVYQDNSIEASKAMFLAELINWRHAERTGQPDKVWVFGHGSHGSDLPQGSATRLAWIELVRWMNAKFIGKTTAGGSTIASYDTQQGVADAYFTWEQQNPGASSHSYPSNVTNWALYPYLRTVAEELAGAKLTDEPTLAAGLETYVFDRAGTPVVALWSDTASGTVDLSAYFTGPVHMRNAETGAFLGSNPSQVPYGAAAVLVAPGSPYVGTSGTPKIGQTMALEMQGRPGNTGAFLLGTAPANIVLPGMGTLLVDLAATHVVITGVPLDQEGAGRVRIQVPNNPNLSGARLYAQAISQRPGSLTLSQNNVIVDLQ